LAANEVTAARDGLVRSRRSLVFVRARRETVSNAPFLRSASAVREVDHGLPRV